MPGKLLEARLVPLDPVARAKQNPRPLQKDEQMRASSTIARNAFRAQSHLRTGVICLQQ